MYMYINIYIYIYIVCAAVAPVSVCDIWPPPGARELLL